MNFIGKMFNLHKIEELEYQYRATANELTEARHQHSQKIATMQLTLTNVHAKSETLCRELETSAIANKQLLSELSAAVDNLNALRKAHSAGQEDYGRLQKEKDFIAARLEEVKKAQYVPTESEFTDKIKQLEDDYAKLRREHDDCVKYGGETVTHLLKHRDALLKETESRHYKNYKLAHGIK